MSNSDLSTNLDVIIID